MTSPIPPAPLTEAASGGAPGATTAAGPPPRPRWLRWFYLVLAMAGAVLPWMANWQFLQGYGSAFDIGRFVRLANANPAAASLSRDLLVASLAFTVWMVHESRRLRMRGLPWVLLGCVTVAFAFGGPLFLHLRERRLDEMEREQAPH